MDKGCQKVLELLSSQTKDINITDIGALKSIATISGNDSAVGDLVGDAYFKVGSAGVVTLAESHKNEDYLELTEGYTFQRGYMTPYFITDFTKMKAEYTSSPEYPVNVLLWEGILEDMNATCEFLDWYVSVYCTGRIVPLLMITDNPSSDVLATLVHNHCKTKSIKVLLVPLPDFGEVRAMKMQDIAIATGATYYSKELGVTINKVVSDRNAIKLGTCNKVISSAGETTIIYNTDRADDIQKHIETLNQQSSLLVDKKDKEILKERISKLSGSVAIVHIGANSDQELLEKKFRFEDAINATKGAIEGGIVVGGGKALVNCWNSLQEYTLQDTDENIGLSIFKEALTFPAKIIANNAGLVGDAIVEKLKELDPNTGLDAKTGKYVDLFQQGIIDPAKVTRSALQNATSIAGAYLSCSGIIVQKEIK